MTWLMGNFPTNRGLVGIGGFNPSEKYEFVSWDDYSPYMESHKSHVPVTTNQRCFWGENIQKCWRKHEAQLHLHYLVNHCPTVQSKSLTVEAQTADGDETIWK
jgi:hypothetical protein